MCLAIPMKLIQMENLDGIVESSGVKREVRLDLLEEVELGDYLLIHAGYAIQRLDAQEAKETLELIEQMLIVEGDAP